MHVLAVIVSQSVGAHRARRLSLSLSLSLFFCVSVRDADLLKFGPVYVFFFLPVSAFALATFSSILLTSSASCLTAYDAVTDPAHIHNTCSHGSAHILTRTHGQPFLRVLFLSLSYWKHRNASINTAHDIIYSYTYFSAAGVASARWNRARHRSR